MIGFQDVAKGVVLGGAVVCVSSRYLSGLHQPASSNGNMDCVLPGRWPVLAKNLLGRTLPAQFLQIWLARWKIR
jgi:hypothetical protein